MLYYLVYATSSKLQRKILSLKLLLDKKSCEPLHVHFYIYLVQTQILEKYLDVFVKPISCFLF